MKRWSAEKKTGALVVIPQSCEVQQGSTAIFTTCFLVTTSPPTNLFTEVLQRSGRYRYQETISRIGARRALTSTQTSSEPQQLGIRPGHGFFWSREAFLFGRWHFGLPCTWRQILLQQLEPGNQARSHARGYVSYNLIYCHGQYVLYYMICCIQYSVDCFYNIM